MLYATKKSEVPISGTLVNEGRGRFKNNFAFLTNIVNTEFRLEKEVWAYEPISFIGDMGGSLGLFIGVSFLSVWDFGEYAFDIYKQYRD